MELIQRFLCGMRDNTPVLSKHNHTFKNTTLTLTLPSPYKFHFLTPFNPSFQPSIKQPSTNYHLSAIDDALIFPDFGVCKRVGSGVSLTMLINIQDFGQITTASYIYIKEQFENTSIPLVLRGEDFLK